MIKFVAGIIVGAIIMFFVLIFIGAYAENKRLRKQIQEINQDRANNDDCSKGERK